MNVIVLSVSCYRHPETPLNADVLARDAIRDGTIGHVTVTRADTGPSEGQTYRSLAASLDLSLGRVLIVDCACRIQAGLLQAMANAEGTVVVVADPSVDRESAARDNPARPSTALVLNSDDGHSVKARYLGCLLLANDDRGALREVIADGRPAASWTEVISRLAKRTRVGFVVLARDVHESEVIMEKSLAGGSYARTYVRLQPSFTGRVVRKEAHGEGLRKLADEIIWLDRLESTAREHFPVLRGYRIEPSAVSMDLTYHHLPTLRRLIFNGDIDEEEAAAWVRHILIVLGTQLYPAGDRPTPDDYVHRTHLDRIKDRLRTCAEALPNFHELWSAEKIQVNGRWRVNVPTLVAEIGSSRQMLALLTPDRLVRTHGDLHFDNILIDRDNRRFLLIDPRGNPGYDMAYDLGKVWHSVHSMYDLIHEGRVAATTSGPRIDYEFTSPELLDFYTRVHRSLLSWLDSLDRADPQPHWMLRLRLAEASHMCSVMPFHIANDLQETVVLACYARGIELINDLYSDLKMAITAR